jgi:hypothetical protein
MCRLSVFKFVAIEVKGVCVVWGGKFTSNGTRSGKANGKNENDEETQFKDCKVGRERTKHGWKIDASCEKKEETIWEHTHPV